MQISIDVGIPIVKAFEGCHAAVSNRPGFFTTYYDIVGVLTIGYGHTNLGGVLPKIAKGDVWSQQDCTKALANDMRRFEERVNRILAGVTLTQYEFDALVSFDFNTGGLDKSSIPAKIKSGRSKEVYPTLMKWNHAGGKVVAGLTRRRDCEGHLFNGQIDTALKIAGTERESPALMARRVDRPRVPVKEVAKAGTPEIAVAAVSSGTAVTGQATRPNGPDTTILNGAAVGFGVVVLVAAVCLLIARWRRMDADWA